jgi:phosphoserine phosphatase RsbU/P
MHEGSTTERLKFCNFKLEALLNITQAINQNLSVHDLLQEYESLLRKNLSIGKVLLYQLNQSQWDVALQSGFRENTFSAISVEKDLMPFKAITTTSLSPNPLLHVFDIIVPVVHNEKPIAYVLIGDIDEEKEGISPTIKHLRFIQTVTNIIVVAIENKRLYRAALRQEAFKKELEVASKMQEMLVPDPKSFPKNEFVALHSFYHPHYEVGGDYFDYLPLNKKEFGFCIADVTGKGITAALLMSNFQANLRALFNEKIQLTELIEKLNALVLSATNGDRFITLFVGKYNIPKRKLEFINAGHNPPILYEKRKEEYTWLKDGCVGLGMLDKIPKITKGQIKILPESKLICYTDGLAEIEDDAHNQIGTDMIEKFLATDKGITEVIKDLITDLNITKENTSLFDDITMLGIEFF